MSQAEQEQLELQKAEAFANEVPRLDGIDSIRVELGTDWAGDRALTLVFQIRRDLPSHLGRDWIRSFNRYAGEIQDRILLSDIDRFPYTRIERAA